MKLPNGYGSVVFLGKKRRRPWAARLTVGWNEDKKQIYKYLSYHEKRTDALTALIEYNKDPYEIETVALTFADIYAAWSERKFEEFSKSTVNNYKNIYNKCGKLYDVPFRAIKTAHLQAVVDDYKTLSQVRLFKILFAHLYAYALKNDITEKDYSQYVDIPSPQAAREQKQPYSAEDIATIWENKDAPFADLLLILLYTGMRISELLIMETKNVFIDEGYMVGGLKTEAGKNRIIPIHAEIMPLIKARYNPDNKYLFSAKRGGKIQYSYFFNEYFTPLMRELNINHTLHETRHTFISQADRCGLNPTILKKIVGHSNGDITLHYTHKDKTELLEEIKKFRY
jgi:integrase